MTSFDFYIVYFGLGIDRVREKSVKLTLCTCINCNLSSRLFMTILILPQDLQSKVKNKKCFFFFLLPATMHRLKPSTLGSRNSEEIMVTCRQSSRITLKRNKYITSSGILVYNIFLIGISLYFLIELKRF